jgi:hypothetical protein
MAAFALCGLSREKPRCYTIVPYIAEMQVPRQGSMGLYGFLIMQ